MAITFTQERKQQRYLLMVSGLVVLVTVFVIWFGFLRTKEESAAPSVSSGFVMPKMEIPWQVLDNLRKEKMPVPFVQIQGSEEGFGRQNPFVPY